jgi:DNA-binding NtrC family response regulator
LIDHFLERSGVRRELSPQLWDTLRDYDWPGNVRELENCIQRMVALNSGPVLTPADLPSALAGDFASRQPIPAALAAAAAAECGPKGIRLPDAPLLRLEELEKQAILQALEYTHGERGRAAELLGIGRTTLYRRIKAYHL